MSKMRYVRVAGRTVAERLEARLVDQPNIVYAGVCCREFTGGSTNPQGYGKTSYKGGKFVYAHRLAWELANGRPVPPGMKVCHHCDNPPCCEPIHLFLGTQAQNIADRDAKRRQWNQDKPRCKRGHAFSVANTYIRPDGDRACKACQKMLDARCRAA